MGGEHVDGLDREQAGDQGRDQHPRGAVAPGEDHEDRGGAQEDDGDRADHVLGHQHPPVEEGRGRGERREPVPDPPADQHEVDADRDRDPRGVLEGHEQAEHAVVDVRARAQRAEQAGGDREQAQRAPGDEEDEEGDVAAAHERLPERTRMCMPAFLDAVRRDPSPANLPATCTAPGEPQPGARHR